MFVEPVPLLLGRLCSRAISSVRLHSGGFEENTNISRITCSQWQRLAGVMFNIVTKVVQHVVFHFIQNKAEANDQSTDHTRGRLIEMWTCLILSCFSLTSLMFLLWLFYVSCCFATGELALHSNVSEHVVIIWKHQTCILDWWDVHTWRSKSSWCSGFSTWEFL